jgi:uridine kinase
MPYIVGIAGGTGSGKSTLAEKMMENFAGEALLIRHDNYYRDQTHMTPEERSRQNYDHPAAFEDSLLVEHLRSLCRGESVVGPLYDFSAHTRRPEGILLNPCHVIVVEGILALHNPDLRQLYDLKVYVDTDADIRILRRMTRDLVERGRSLQSVVEQYLTTVRPMHNQFVEPSKRHADIIVPEGGLNTAAVALLAAQMRQALQQASQQS